MCALLLAFFAGGAPAWAHELPPAVADLTREGDDVNLAIRVNLEALVAGIPVGSDSTDAPEELADYERLRALSGPALKAAVSEWSQVLLDGVVLQSAQGRLALGLDTLAIPDAGNVKLARDSVVILSAPWPAGVPALQLGWRDEFGGLIVRAGASDDINAFSQYLLPGDVSDPVPLPMVAGLAGTEPARSGLESFVDYVRIGFVHIVPRGLDHILFVIALFLLSPRFAPIAWQVSVFTLAHSITLAAGTLGHVTLPASVVEPLIALSIALVALENVFATRLHAHRLVLVFGFGLLHGLGFAGVLAQAGLDENRFLLSLFGFNAGVEIGQLCVVAVCFAMVGRFRDAPGYRRAVIIPGSACVGAVGLFWFAQRLVG